MNLSLLSSLTKSSDAPQTAGHGDPAVSQDNDFADIFGTAPREPAVDPALLPTPKGDGSEVAEPTVKADPETETPLPLMSSDTAIRESERKLFPDQSSEPRPVQKPASEQTTAALRPSGEGTQNAPERTEAITADKTTVAVVSDDSAIPLPISKTPERATKGHVDVADTTTVRHVTASKPTTDPSQIPVTKVALPDAVATGGIAPIQTIETLTQSPVKVIVPTAQNVRTDAGEIGIPNETPRPTGLMSDSASTDTDITLAPLIKREPTSPISTLERHLNGLPATLVSTPKAGQKTNASVLEMIRLVPETRRPADATMAPSTPVEFTVADKAGATMAVLVQTTKAHGPSVSVSDPKRGNGSTDPILDGFSDDVAWDFRAPTATPGTVHMSNPHRMDMAGSVAQQIVDAIRRSPDRPIEIALNPVELGKVRMVLSASDAGITVSILAERPETLDLLRRNIDDLGKSFSDMGYEDISFSFGNGDQMTGDSEPQDTDTRANDGVDMTGPAPTTAPMQLTSVLATAPGGIDMRL